MLGAAVGRIEALETMLSEMEGRDSEMEGSVVDEEVTKPIGSADGSAASVAAEPEAVGRHEKPPRRWGWIPG